MSHLKRVWLPAKNLSEALQPKKYDDSGRGKPLDVSFRQPARGAARLPLKQNLRDIWFNIFSATSKI
jgi:hypothetical protein